MAKSKTNIRIYNSSKQLISLHIRPPKGDFFITEQQVRLLPGKDVTLPKDHVMMDQIENLQKRNIIKVIYDSETIKNSL